MANLYIIRGVPGSGKTTLAKKMNDYGMIGVYFEADMFMIDDSGNYKFDQSKLSFCHDLCQRCVNDALEAGYDVAVSNTFTRKWEMNPYIDMAEKHGALATVIVCQGDYGNTHGVPDDKVHAMRDRFEY